MRPSDQTSSRDDKSDPSSPKRVRSSRFRGFRQVHYPDTPFTVRHPSIVVRLLGRFSVTYRGLPVESAVSSRAQSIIAYLAIHRDRRVSRTELASISWPETTDDQARANLRKVLHQLRQDVWSASLLNEQPSGLGWIPQIPVSLDVAEFETALFQRTTSALEYARDLYRGPLLSALDEEWVQSERNRLQQLYSHCLTILCERYLARAAHTQALTLVKELMQLDPLDEAYHRLGFRTHAARKDLATLTHAFNEMVELLAKELHEVPSGETEAMFHNLRQSLAKGAWPDSRQVVVPASPEVSPTLPGRPIPNQNRSVIMEAYVEWLLNRASPPVFYLWAPPGSGKTRWLHSAEELARQHGFQITWEASAAWAEWQSNANRHPELLLIDGKERAFAAWFLSSHPAQRWPKTARVVLTGNLGPEGVWGAAHRWSVFVRCATLDPVSPQDITDDLKRRGAVDPALVEEILHVTGGLPKAVTLAVRQWEQSGVSYFTADDRWRAVGHSLADHVQTAMREEFPVDPRILAVCSLLRHVEPTLLSALCGRIMSSDEIQNLIRSGLFLRDGTGLALRGEIRRIMAQDFKAQQPVAASRLFQEVMRCLLQGWDDCPASIREYLASECIFAIREYRNLNPEGYLLPRPDLTVVTPSPEDLGTFSQLLKFWLQSEQAAGSSRLTEWDRLMAYQGKRIRVVRDHHGTILGFNLAIPVREDSRALLLQGTTEELIRRGVPPSASGDGGWVLRLVVYGPQRSAQVLELLEDDLMGLFGISSAVYVATPLTRYHRLLPALGFRQLSGSIRWSNGKLRPVRNYVLELPHGFAHWMREYCSEWSAY